MFRKCVRQYLLNSSFHGLRFLAKSDVHWTEKIFWSICCILSWYASGLLMMSSFNDYQNNAISFVVETDYLDWNTSFPSLVICETQNSKKLQLITDKLYGDPHDYNLDEIMNEVVFYRGSSFYTVHICDASNPACQKENFHNLSSAMRSSCKDIMRNCKWNDKEFDCCTYFADIRTEFGLCYALNSVQSSEETGKRKKLDIVSNKKLGAGRFYMEVLGNVNFYILGEQEVPSLSTLQSDVMEITPGIEYKRYIAINEIDNVKEVREVSISQRNCRFLDENDGIDVYSYYSYSVCCVQCRKNAQLQKCHCNHHFVPNTQINEQCDANGLQCLSEHSAELSTLKPHWANKTGLICECLPSCTELEMTMVRDIKHKIDGDYAIILLKLDRLPSERYKRNVIKGKLDLVVSLGGTAGLFIGASLLTFVEIFYYFVMRPIGDFMK